MIPSPFHGIFSASFDQQNDVASGKRVRQPAEEPSAASTGLARGQGQVALDIFEFDNYYIIKAPIAGVKLPDLDIEITDSTVTIRGERKQTDTIPQDQYYLQECFWGPFSRTVTLPCSIDQRKVKATFNKDSVLKILIPKEERVKIIRVND